MQQVMHHVFEAALSENIGQFHHILLKEINAQMK